MIETSDHAAQSKRTQGPKTFYLSSNESFGIHLFLADEFRMYSQIFEANFQPQYSN
jgi:hypothetical protein